MPEKDIARPLFTGVASSYELTSQLLSYGQYRGWHRRLVGKLVLPEPALVLDMATGTGAVAFRVARRPQARVIAADVTRAMLLQAQAALRRGDDKRPDSIDLVECSAEAIPFPDAVFDAVIFTYLLRYVSDVPATLRELTRVVRPGGMMVSQDFAVPRGVWYPLWRLHTDVVLRVGGALISPGWRRAGAFLGGSIRDFYRRWPEESIVGLWRECGFPDVRAERLSLGGALVMWGTRAS
jgi:demethylmenaquinone methyltransferase/2-methoxy-6-polyprenyl-1,4-benzoquinol methylase